MPCVGSKNVPAPAARTGRWGSRRARGRLSEGEVAERLYREAIERLAPHPHPCGATRAHLHYGECLRRERRRLDAREQLRCAYDAFAAMGAEGFAERAHRELLATGERRASARTRLAVLTPQRAGSRDSLAKGSPTPRSAPVVHQPAHGRIPLAQGVRKAGHRFPRPSRPRPRGRRYLAGLGRFRVHRPGSLSAPQFAQTSKKPPVPRARPPGRPQSAPLFDRHISRNRGLDRNHCSALQRLRDRRRSGP